MNKEILSFLTFENLTFNPITFEWFQVVAKETERPKSNESKKDLTEKVEKAEKVENAAKIENVEKAEKAEKMSEVVVMRKKAKETDSQMKHLSQNFGHGGEVFVFVSCHFQNLFKIYFNFNFN